MSRPNVRVQHAVLCHTTRQYGSVPTSDLLGVQYTYAFPPDREFPQRVPQMDLFTRFFIERPGTDDLYVRVWRLFPDGRQTPMCKYGPFRVQFQPGDGFRDQHFRLRDVRVEGKGSYAVKLCRKMSRGWKGKRYQVLKTEYFHVEVYP
jgi:hypothetical protein